MKFTKLFFLLGIFPGVMLYAQPTQETIFVQTDQPAYLAGSGVNIKAWIFSGNQSVEAFSNLYVDLLNDRQEIVSSSILPAWRGQASGGLVIPASLDESVYYLHAYTLNTKNLLGKHGYVVPVPILNQQSKQKLVRDTALRWTASVHVEGGQLFADQATRVVVRMHANSPVGFGWRAEIRNRSGKRVTRFDDKDDNVGISWLTPAKGERYMAYIIDQYGKDWSAPLPDVQDSGAFFQVSSGLKSVRYGVSLRGATQSRGPFSIRGTQHGQVVYTAVLAENRLEAAGAIPVDSLNRGSLYLELLDECGELLSDRLCYVRVPDSLPPFVVDSLSTPLGSRAMQVCRFKGIEGLYRAFVFARVSEKISLAEPENLFSQLYLSSLSKEALILPARYFEGDSLLHLLDALYITLSTDFRTHVRQVEPLTPWKKDSLLSFRGKAYGRSGPLVNQDLNLVIRTADQASSFQQITTDSSGGFLLENLYFTDSATVFYQMNEATDRNRNDIAISLTSVQRPDRQKITLPSSGWILSNNQQASLPGYPAERIVQATNAENDFARRIKVLTEVKVVAQKKSKTRVMDDELSSGLFKSGDVSIVDLVNDYPEAAGFTNIFSFLQGKFPSLQYSFQNGEYEPRYRGGRIFIAIDEVPSSTGLANLLLPANIAMVKLQRYNILLGGPVLAIYTRRGAMASGNTDNIRGMNWVTIRGYGKEISRSKVDYRNMEPGNTVEDERLTLYWNDLFPNEDGGALETIRFFRNDSGSQYRLTVVGMLENGLPLLMTDRVY
jgi:hypothetical protein